MAEYTPSELLRKYDELRAPLTSAEFFRQPGLQRLREMWCAARLAAGFEHHFGKCAVLIDDVDDQRSGDFSVSFVGGLTHSFEQAEVQKPGRRRGDEYRDRAPGSRWLEPFMEPEEAAESIRTAIEAKAKKLYSDQAELQLLVYVNLGASDLCPSKVQQHCQTASQGFAGVWLLTGELFACIHQTPIQITDPQWMTLPPRE